MKIISLVLLIFTLNSCFLKKNVEEENITNSGKIVKENTGSTENPKLVELKKLGEINKKLVEGEYKQVISDLEAEGLKNLTDQEKLRLLGAYLSYGNYYYKESDISEKVNSLLETMPESWETYYAKGYLKEINNSYSGAVADYKKALSYDLGDKNRAVVVNQIGHVYDLYGYTEVAFKNYESAYSLDSENGSVILNLSRYYTATGEIEKAIEYKLKSLEFIKQKPIISEIYFGLSSLELGLNGLNPDVTKSIEYAQKSIEAYPNYPMGYVAIARGLYMKNDSKNYSEIEENLNKAIELNPNNYLAYKYYMLLELDRGDKEEFIKYLEKAGETLMDDPILMNSEIDFQIASLYFYRLLNEELLNEKKTKATLLKFIKDNGGVENLEIRFQLKRENYGLFSDLTGDKTLSQIIKTLK